jgi:hypothetical protein
MAAYLEATQLAGFAPEFSHALMPPLPATKAASQYLAAFAKLQAGS